MSCIKSSNSLLQYIYTDEKYRIELRRLGLLIHDARERLEEMGIASEDDGEQIRVQNEIIRLNDEYTKIQKKIRGRRTGVMVAVPKLSEKTAEDGKNIVEIEIGFSFLNKEDKWDFIGKKHVSGFGVSLAMSRGEALYTKTFKDFLYIKDEEGCCFSSRIPIKYTETIFNFIDRCKRYYKDKDDCCCFVFPMWVRDPTGPFFRESLGELYCSIYNLI